MAASLPAAAAVVVETEDGQAVPIPADLLPQLTLLATTLRLGGRTDAQGRVPIPLPKVTSSTLAKVLEYAAVHRDDPLLAAAPAGSGAAAPPHIAVALRLPSGAQSDDDGEAEWADPPSPGLPSGSSEDEDAVEAYGLEEADDLVSPADRKFAQALDLPTVIGLTSAANYLAMEPLLDLCCKTIAAHMTGLTPEELRAKFNVTNDFSPEEEERMRSEFGWADA